MNNKHKDLILKIIQLAVVPILGFGFNYIKNLEHKINSIQQWQITTEDKKVYQKITDMYPKLNNIEKDIILLNEKISEVIKKQDDRAFRSNTKFDKYEEEIKQNAIDIAFLKGFIKKHK